MNEIAGQKGFLDTALMVTFSPIVIGFLIGALPILVPLLIGRGISRAISGRQHGTA